MDTCGIRRFGRKAVACTNGATHWCESYFQQNSTYDDAAAVKFFFGVEIYLLGIPFVRPIRFCAAIRNGAFGAP